MRITRVYLLNISIILVYFISRHQYLYLICSDKVQCCDYQLAIRSLTRLDDDIPEEVVHLVLELVILRILRNLIQELVVVHTHLLRLTCKHLRQYVLEVLLLQVERDVIQDLEDLHLVVTLTQVPEHLEQCLVQ